GVFPPLNAAISLAIRGETSVQGHDRAVRLVQGSASAEAEQRPRVEVELAILLEMQAADHEPAILQEAPRSQLKVVAPLRRLVVDLADDRIDRECRQVVAQPVLGLGVDLEVKLVVRG